MRHSYFILLILLASCSTQPNIEIQKKGVHPPLKNGIWRFSFQLGKEELPFNVRISGDGETIENFTILNGAEKIRANKIVLRADSIFIELPVFASVLKARIESSNLITGEWINKSKKDYSIPFVGEANKAYLFTPTKIAAKTSDRYRVVFDKNSDNPWNAILILNTDSNKVTGTFLTETGDYRYLQGNVINEKLFLSTFDGSHAFLFTAEIEGDSLKNGTFTSGIHYTGSWLAKADSTYQLRDPKKLTYLKSGYKHIDFNLPNENGDTVSWNDLDLTGKVVILEITGSWCPNCMDATRALKKLTKEYGENEIRIIPVAYEPTTNFKITKKRIFKMQTDLGVDHRFLFGGLPSTENTSSDFPMLNGIMSFPTLIFIGKDRSVKEIYTGFYGPGTGEHYEKFMTHGASLLEQMVEA